VQQKGGSFQQTNKPLWEYDKRYEDHGALLFDADGDGDQELVTGNFGLNTRAGGFCRVSPALLRQGHFTFIENTASGFWAMKQARDLALLRVGGKPVVLVANNGAAPQLFWRK
jgi:hypothetical protein